MIPALNSAYFNEAAAYEARWQNEGLLEGLGRKTKRDRDIRYATAMMLEHQRLANEQTAPATMTGSDDIAQFRRISIPMVRRSFAQLIAHHVVGVQPLSTPAGYVYYMRFRAAITKGDQPGVDNAAGDVKYPTAGWDAASLQQKQDGTAVIPLWFSHQRVNRAAVSTTPNDARTVWSGALGKIPILADSLVALQDDATDIGVTAGAKYTACGLIKIADAGTPTVLTTQAKFYMTSSATTIVAASDATVTVSSITLNLTTGVIAITVSADPTGKIVKVTDLSYEYNLECQADLPRVTLVVESDTVESKTRKLRADWSIEAQQDLKASHNLDVEAEVTSFLSEQVNLEVDREIIEDLRKNAGTAQVWDFSTAIGDTIKEKMEALYVKMVQVSNVIHKKTLRSGANWAIASPETCAIFESATAGFAPAAINGWEMQLGVQYVGTVMQKFRLFKDPGSPSTSIIMGFRGDSNMDTGYFYCPYVALMQGPLLYDPETGCPRKGIMTRYGKILLREGARYYGRIATTGFLDEE